MPRLARLLIGGAVILSSLVAASPAQAATPCDGTAYAQDGRELFTLEDRYVPPPLKPFPPACASRVADRPFGSETGQAVEYLLVYYDIDVDFVVQVVRSFEEHGWLAGRGAITSVDDATGAGLRSDVSIGADGLAAREVDPWYLMGRFGNAATGDDIIRLTYADGDHYTTDGAAFDVPTLWVSVQLTSFGGGSDATGFGDPSVLSGLTPIGDLALTPAGAALVGGSAVMLMLVVGYPGSLLNTVIAQRYDQASAGWRRRFPPRAKRGATPAPAPRSRRVPRWLFIPGLVLASIITGFVDPDFGFNLMSLRVLLTECLMLLVFNIAAWSLVRTLVRRVQPDAVADIRFRWGSLVLVVVATALARLLDFYPGIVFGLVAGLAFAVTLSASREALVVLLGAGFGLAVGLVGWVVYSALTPLTASGGPAVVFVSEFFSGLTLAGISSLPLALLPLLTLEGAKLFAWKKWVWAACYAVGLAAFMLVLLTVPSAWGEIPGDFVRWLLLFGGFGVVSVAVWAVNLWLIRRKTRAPSSDAPPTVPDSVPRSA